METWAKQHPLGGKSVCLSPAGGGGHGLEQCHRVIGTSFREDCQASESESVSHSVVSDSLQPHRL